jgi:hypothetical protein
VSSRRCLETGTAPALALALALDCTEQGSNVSPDLRKQVKDLIDAAARPGADAELRRLFAGSLLSRHLRQRERTAAGAQLCPQPIPASI